MFSKTIFIAAFAAVASIASAASPPACLLGAVNGYSDPADVGAVCKNKDITSKVSQFCGDATADALEALSDICNKAGVKVSTDIPTSTGSSKPSGTGASNGTSSGVAQPTGTGAATGTGLATGGGPVSTGTPTQSGGVTESTGAAGRLELSFVGMVAGLGVMAAAL